MKIRSVLAFILCVPSLSSAQFAGSPMLGKFLQADFIFEKTEANKITERMEGSFRHHAARSRLDIVFPVTQSIMITDSDMVVFYPETLQAFRYLDGSRQVVPIVSSVLSVYKPDYGLEAIGFYIDDLTTAADTITSRWKSSQAQVAATGLYFELMHIQDALMWIVMKDPANKMEIITSIDSYVDLGGVAVPERITTRKVGFGRVVVESITLSRIILSDAPDVPVSLELPERTTIRTYKN